MDQILTKTLNDVINDLNDKDDHYRYLIGISGYPGSGKSSLTRRLSDGLNKKGIKTCAISMDGWHYTRDQLSKFANPTEAFDRRGAPFTFDAKAFTDFVNTLKFQPDLTLYGPTFDHSIKDPTPNGIEVAKDNRIIILEGNYVLLNEGEWLNCNKHLDKRLWVDVNEETAKARLIMRHVKSGICKNEEEALIRVNDNDLLNGKYARSRLLNDTLIINSIDDTNFGI